MLYKILKSLSVLDYNTNLFITFQENELIIISRTNRLYAIIIHQGKIKQILLTWFNASHVFKKL